jgi:hypothetical protein
MNDLPGSNWSSLNVGLDRHEGVGKTGPMLMLEAMHQKSSSVLIVVKRETSFIVNEEAHFLMPSSASGCVEDFQRSSASFDVFLKKI